MCVWKFDINATWRFLSKTFILKCFVHLVVLLDERCFEKALNSAVYFFLGGGGKGVCVGGGGGGGGGPKIQLLTNSALS